MISIFLFALSIGLQIAAAVFALVLIRTTGRKFAWISLSLGMVLMAGRRIASFALLLTAGKAMTFELPEIIALISSGLMLMGVLRIGAYFRSIREVEEKRTTAEDELRVHENRLKNLIELHRLDQATEKEIFDFTLEASLSSVQSTFAFVCKMSRDESVMIVQAWSRGTMEQCAVTDNPIHYPLADLGLLGEIVRQRRPIIVNDYEKSMEFKKGCPTGHVPIKRFLCVPVFRDDRIVAVAAVANKASEYDEHDVSAFTSLLNEMWNLIERKQAEKIIRESEARLRRITEAISDYIYSVRIDEGAQVETTHGEGCVAVTGYTKEEFADDPYLWIEMVVEEDSDIVLKQAEDILAGRSPLPIEHRIIRKDGAVRWIENSIVPKHDGDGNLTSYDGIIRDITGRKRAEEALRALSSRQKAILAAVPDIIVEVDNDMVYTFANQAGYEFFGDAMIGKEAAFYFEGEQNTYDLVAPLFGGSEKIIYVESWQRRKDGAKRLLAWWSRVLKNENGNVTGALSSARDITENKKSEELIRGIFESVDEGFLIIDRDYRIISANRAFAEVAKMPVENIIGKHCYEVSHASVKPCYEAGEDCAVRSVFEKGKTHMVIHKHYAANGTPIHIKTKAYPLTTDDDGNVVTAIETLIDITQEKQLEDQLRQSQKMEAVGQLAGGVAHDFNNILSAIIGYGNIALVNIPKDNPERLNIEHMLEAADRATHLTKDLLLFSRKQISDRKPVDLNEVVRRVEKFLMRVIGEDIVCKTSLHTPSSLFAPPHSSPGKGGIRGDEGLMVLADAHQLEQVLMNLATNARDAMPMGGEFIITTALVRLDEQFISVHEYGREGMYALITVSDTGRGMDEATRKRIFEPFFTTKEIGKGTGLGLAVVYGIVKQHEGYINVYSEPGKGTTFRIYLPLISSEARAENRAHREEAPARGTEMVLVAEDDESLRKLSSIILTQHGYTVIEAVDGEDAVRRFMENKDRIHILLLDLIMPKMNGKEAYDEIRKIKSEMKVIFSSGYAPDLVRQKVSPENGAHLIFKPMSPMELLRKVRSVLDE